MKDNKFEKEILEKIEEKKIKPKPKWEFFLKNYLLWIFGVLSLVIGSLAVSIIIYMLLHNDWQVYKSIHDNLLGFILVTLPYFWIVILTLFIIAADYNLKHTKKGYKYNLSWVIIISLGVNIIFGALLYNIGVGEALDDIMGEKAPFYEKVINRKVHMWDCPEKGRLVGEIIMVDSQEIFRLHDKENNIWTIFHKDAEIFPILKLETGEKIKIMGENLENFNFQAYMIIPMGPGKGFFKRMPHPKVMHMINNIEFVPNHK